jgi:hypothetical protein
VGGAPQVAPGTRVAPGEQVLDHRREPRARGVAGGGGGGDLVEVPGELEHLRGRFAPAVEFGRRHRGQRLGQPVDLRTGGGLHHRAQDRLDVGGGVDPFGAGHELVGAHRPVGMLGDQRQQLPEFGHRERAPLGG